MTTFESESTTDWWSWHFGGVPVGIGMGSVAGMEAVPKLGGRSSQPSKFAAHVPSRELKFADQILKFPVRFSREFSEKT
jgi:hypothetical protein